jgi:hypothetical protein
MFMSLVTSWFYACVASFTFEEVQDNTDFNVIVLLGVLDIYYGLVIAKNFVTGFVSMGNEVVEENLKLISRHYLSNGGVADIIIWIPFQTLSLLADQDSNINILYWIKVLRIFSVFEFIPKKFIKQVIYKRQMEYNAERSKRDYLFSESIYEDHTNINVGVIVDHVYNLGKLVLGILNIAFFVGLLFKTFIHLLD